MYVLISPTWKPCSVHFDLIKSILLLPHWDVSLFLSIALSPSRCLSPSPLQGEQGEGGKKGEPGFIVSTVNYLGGHLSDLKEWIFYFLPQCLVPRPSTSAMCTQCVCVCVRVCSCVSLSMFLQMPLSLYWLECTWKRLQETTKNNWISTASPFWFTWLMTGQNEARLLPVTPAPEIILQNRPHC